MLSILTIDVIPRNFTSHNYVFETSLICDSGVHNVVLSLIGLPDDNMAG